MSFLRYKNIFINLFIADLSIFKKTFVDKMINSSIWVSSVVAISAYIMPYLGTGESYGPLIAAGTIVSVGGFECFPQMAQFISDLHGDKIIDYHLSLPIPNWLLFVRMGFYYALNSLLLMVNGSIVCSIVLWNQLDFANISLLKYILAMFSVSLFFGFFTLFMISVTKDILKLDNAFMRFAYPLWFLGGFQFPWSVLYKASPTLAKMNLINPYVYGTEVIRGVVMGPENFLPFWNCIGALFVLTIIAGAIGIYKIKKRLEYV